MQACCAYLPKLLEHGRGLRSWQSVGRIRLGIFSSVVIQHHVQRPHHVLLSVGATGDLLKAVILLAVIRPTRIIIASPCPDVWSSGNDGLVTHQPCSGERDLSENGW